MLKLVNFDVGNGNCALIFDDYDDSLVIDGGCHSEKLNPVPMIKFFQMENNWLRYRNLNLVSIHRSFLFELRNSTLECWV